MSKARKAGVKLPPPEKGEASEKTRKRARRDLKAGARKEKPDSTRRRATTKALKHEGRSAASERALGAHARKAARKRTAGERSADARKAARTRGAAGRSQAAKKAARTRARAH